jgi:hypothetical protein
LRRMAEEETLRANVRHLFAKLPQQSALRRPLIRVLLDGLSQDEVRSLGLPVKESTIKRYRKEECDLSPLFLKRSRVVGAVNTAFVKREEVATDWIVAECGVTQSGRVRTVFKTELSFFQLFQRYQDSVLKGDQVSSTFSHVSPSNSMYTLAWGRSTR